MNEPTRTITFQLDARIYEGLRMAVHLCNQVHSARDGANTHGQLTIETALAMLAEDLALTATRPGSWEGANMLQVLCSHGYA